MLHWESSQASKFPPTISYLIHPVALVSYSCVLIYTIQSVPLYYISLKSILILSSQVRLSLPSYLFPLCFAIKNFVRISHSSRTRYMLRSYSPWFDYPNVFGEEYKLWCSSFWNFLYSITFSLLDTNTLFSTLFYDILNLCSLRMNNQVSHPHKATCKTVGMHEDVRWTN